MMLSPPFRALPSPPLPVKRRSREGDVRKCVLLDESWAKPGLVPLPMLTPNRPPTWHTTHNTTHKQNRVSPHNSWAWARSRCCPIYPRQDSSYKVVRRRKSFQFSPRRLFGRRPHHTHQSHRPLLGALSDYANESNPPPSAMSDACLALGTTPPVPSPSLSPADRHPLRYYQPIYERQMNAWWTPDTLCMLCVHHGSDSI